jgi:hypothetical protein
MPPRTSHSNECSLVETELVQRCAFRYTEIEMLVPGSIPLNGYSPDGVDLTLIRWFLSLTPAQRLDFHARG